MSDLVGAIGEQLVAQARRDLDMPDTGRRLAVGDPQSRAVGVVQAHVPLQDVERFSDPGTGVAEHRAHCAPADAIVGCRIGLALREHRHRPGAQPILMSEGVLRLPQLQASPDLRCLFSCELGALARPGRGL
ncbi:MAG: hypothetical protein WBV85_07785 [Solirubrobacteraceae bacterium]